MNGRGSRSDQRRTGGKPRILMFAPVCFPPAQPESIVNSKLVLAMREAGWQVDVIAAASRKSEWYPSRQECWASIRECVHLVDPTPWRKWSRIRVAMSTGMILDDTEWAVNALRQAIDLARSRQFDFVISRALPARAHLPAMLFHRQTGIPWIANWNDPWPWANFPPPYGTGPDTRLAPRARRLILAMAKHKAWHTFPCERLRRYMGSYMPREILERSSVIPHIALRRFVAPPVPHDGFRLCYAGSLRPPRDARVLLEGARRFIEGEAQSPPLSLVFVTDRPSDVAEAAQHLGVAEYVRIEEGRPYEEMPQLLAAMDVLVLIEPPMAEGVFLPSKFIDYVQAGRPILALSPSNGTIADILSQHEVGLVADGAHPESVAGAIAGLYRSWKAGTLDSAYRTSLLFTLYAEDRVLDLYQRLFEQLQAARLS